MLGGILTMGLFEEERVNGNEPENDKILLIDADTIVYAICSVLEEEDLHPNWPAEQYEEERYTVNLEHAEQLILEKLAFMKNRTGCKEVAFWLSGPNNFRYEIFPNYKTNRKKMRHPAGRQELTKLLCDKYANCFLTDGWEADDEVVYRKHNFPDKYLLAAIDKDVIGATPGRHYNYNKDIFIVTSRESAVFWPYLQCITGDTSDGLKGVPGIGPKKALGFINEEMNEEELWKGVVEAYTSKGLSEKDALVTMYMVNMHQLHENKIVLWRS